MNSGCYNSWQWWNASIPVLMTLVAALSFVSAIVMAGELCSLPCIPKVPGLG